MAHHRFSTPEINFLRQQLLSYYAAHKRNLPWRNLGATLEDPDQRAYSVWVSEIMLQQTQVSTVIEYYNKWIEKWPTVLDLSEASLEEVNEMWSGLGYYSRGRRLHEGAVKLTKQCGEKSGKMPRTAKDLMKELPGVGRYTAGAIASISYNEVTGIVDGNVMRLMSRLRMIGGDISTQPVCELIWELANTVVDQDLPGDFNQCMMDIGATICTPQNPLCPQCPINKICKAYKRQSDECRNQPTITDSFSQKRSVSKMCNSNSKHANNFDTFIPYQPDLVDVEIKNDDDTIKAEVINDNKIGSSRNLSKTEGTISKAKSSESHIKVNLDDAKLDETSTNDDFILTDIEDFANCKFCLSVVEEPWSPQLGVRNYPRKPKKKPPKAEKFISLIIEYNRKFLFTQRPEKGLLANMWEFPLTEVEGENKENIENSIIKKEIARRFSLTLDKMKFCGETSHVFSHRCHLYRVYHAVLSDYHEPIVDADGRATKWMSRVESNDAAITSAITKIMNVKDKKGKRKRSPADNKTQKTLDKMFTKKGKK